VNSYNSAAAIVWELVGLRPDDEVIASPMSCLASNQPIKNRGSNVCWTDIDPYVGSLDPEMVRKNITSKTKAILHYHWGGYPGHIDELLTIGDEFGIPVIEDVIESFGSEYKGKKIGNTGADFSIFSFQPVRLPTTIDGGGIACKKKEDYQKALLLRDYGIDRTNFRDELGEIDSNCDIKLPGIGAGLNEVGAYIGCESMLKIENPLQKQRSRAVKNTELLKKYDNIEFLNTSDSIPNFWIYSFLSQNRDKLLKEFRAEGLYASKVHIRNDYYSIFGEFQDDLLGVKKFNDETLSIPSGWWVE
jgi:dTDP-4-amino-4,6-dideoxygalactose transaminase